MAKVKPAVTVQGECKGVELEKRTYLPGIKVKSSCPKCGKLITRDLKDSYLSYPKVGEPVDAHGYCSDCEVEWPMMIVLKLTVEVA